jgi:hypothetical protein
MKKIKYEKPTSLDAGQVPAVQGATCTGLGSSATDGCISGNNPDLGPTCKPGLNATYNCSAGTTTSAGNCSDGSTARGCYGGSRP